MNITPPIHRLIDMCQNGYMVGVQCALAEHEFHRDALNRALAWAAGGGYLNIVQLLVQSGASPVHECSAPLRFAAIGGFIDVMDYLLSRGADLHDDHDAALRSAVQRGHFQAVDYLIGMGADIHADNDGPIRLACEYNFPDIVNLLLLHGANPRANGDEALYWAARYGHLDVLNILLGLGCQHPDALMIVANKAAAKLLIKKGHVVRREHVERACRFGLIELETFLSMFVN